MPRISLEKIKSVPKKKPVLAAIFGGMLILLMGSAIALMGPDDRNAEDNPRQSESTQRPTKPKQDGAESKRPAAEPEVGGEAVVDTVGTKLGNRLFQLETAVGIEQQQRGLSGRSGLQSGTGMLFEAPAEEDYCMWMKDMQFAIDILWLSSDKKIVKVAQDVRPETYPETFCAPAQYVIELPAGAAKESGIAVGQTVDL